MGLLFKVLAGVLAVSGLILWFSTQAFQRAPVDIPEEAQLAGVAETLDDEGVFERYGLFILDRRSSGPAVPYLLYRTDRGIVSKRLVFPADASCAHGGLVPCAVPTGSAYPPFLPGEVLLVSGEQGGELVLVRRAQVADSTHFPVDIFSLSLGETAQVGSVEVTPISVEYEEGCVYGFGCSSETLSPVTTHIVSGNQEKTVAFLPGVIETYGGMLITLLEEDSEGYRFVIIPAASG